MKTLKLKHEIRCSADQFWQVFFDRGFNETLFREHLRFPKYEILEQTTKDDGSVVRRVSGMPHTDAPGAIKKLLGDSFGYEEQGRLDPATKVWTWSMKTSVLTDKLRNAGTVRVEAGGDQRCWRVAEINIEAKVFGVGGLMESFTEAQMREGWDKSADYMNDWIARHPPA